MKKILLLAAIFSGAVFLSGCAKKEPAETLPGQTAPTSIPTKPVEETIKERPYVSLNVSSDNHWLTIDIKNIRKEMTALEYELTYFADFEGNRIERGISSGGKPVELSNQTEFSKKLLLGSASCTTGACKYKYDENVNEGMLILTLIGSGGKEKYESAFRIQKGKEAKEGLSAGDGVFSLISTALPQNSLYLTISSVGIPVQLPEGVTAKSIPYGVFPNLAGKGTVSFKTSLIQASIYALSGKSWQKLETTFELGKAAAGFSNTSLFILGE